MPIRFEQPSPVAAAGEVGRLQGSAQASNNAQRNQLAAMNMYADQAARMAAIQQQGAGQWTAANVAFAGLDERAHEADLDFANQRAIGQERMEALRMQEQFAAQRQQQMIQARMREQAISEGELTPAEDQQLVRYESGIAEVKKAMAEGRLTQAQAAPLMDRLMGQVSSLRLRKQLTGEKQQQLEMAGLENRQKFMTTLWGNDQAVKSEFMKRHTIEQRLPDGNVRYGLLLPDGKVDWYEAPKVTAADKPKPFSWKDAAVDAEAEADVAFPDQRGVKTEEKSQEWRDYFAKVVAREKAKHEMGGGAGQTAEQPQQPQGQQGGGLTPVGQAHVNKLSQDRQMIEATSNFPGEYKQGHVADLQWAEQVLQQFGDPTQMPDDVLERYVKIHENMDAIRNSGVWRK